jgi:AraC-like DNA-binding protein
MNKAYPQLIEKNNKQFMKGFLAIMTCVYICNLLFFPPPVYHFISYLFMANILINITAIILTCILSLASIRKLVLVYCIALTVILFPLAFFCFQRGIVGPLFWFIATPVCLSVLYPDKRTIAVAAACFVMMLVIFITGCVLHDELHYRPVPYYSIIKPTMVDAIAVFMCICYSLYFIHRLHKIEIAQLQDAHGGNKKNVVSILRDLEKEADNKSKYEEIFKQIETYFNEKHPYLSADFKIGKMAHDLNVNTTYLAKAIQIKTKMNFNNFTNAYRIRKAKELMRNNPQKFTLEYIYLSSGFKHQSSFNAAFKSLEGIVPSEYMKKRIHTHE